MTFAFALRGDMGWVMCGAYVGVQLLGAAGGSLAAWAFFGVGGNLAATVPQPGLAPQAALFEAILTFGLVLMVLSMANGPKLNGQFVPLAVGAYIMSLGTVGGPYEGAAMNPARAFGPDLARGDLPPFLRAFVRRCLSAPRRLLTHSATVQEIHVITGAADADVLEATPTARRAVARRVTQRVLPATPRVRPQTT